MAISHHLKQILIAVDQLFNTITGGWADETFSARVWRKHGYCNGWSDLMTLIDLILGKGHCYQSYCSEQQRRQLPPEYRTIT